MGLKANMSPSVTENWREKSSRATELLTSHGSLTTLHIRPHLRLNFLICQVGVIAPALHLPPTSLGLEEPEPTRRA